MIDALRMPLFPSSYDELKANFGDPESYLREDGTLDPEWENLFITRIPLPNEVPLAGTDSTVGRVTVHVTLAQIATDLYDEIDRLAMWHHLGPYGGGFNFRPDRNNPAVTSLHAWGLAWDWDPAGFPNGSERKRDPALVAIFAKYGFRCGQDFHHPDPMHFSYSSGAIG